MSDTPPSLPPKKFFRDEAIAHQQEKFWGEVLIARPLPLSLLTFFAVLMAAAVAAYLIWGEYTRKVKVSGFLAPQVGMVRIAAPQAGALSMLLEAGAIVKAGDAIASISLERDPGGEARQASLRTEIERRRDSLQAERARLDTALIEQTQQLNSKISALKGEMRALDGETQAQRDRFDALRSIAERHEQLRKDGFVGQNVLEQKRSDALDQKIKLEALGRTLAQLQREVGIAEGEKRSITIKKASAQGEIDRQLSGLDRERVDTDDRAREITVVSPIDGSIATRAATRGQSVSAGSALVSILPAQNDLQAELLIPTRAAGFVKSGQVVALRYQAFPFERFGHARGVVKEIGQAVLSASESAPVTVSEPVYRVVVSLPRQTVSAYGQEMSLRAGMLLDADIALENRKLYEWLVEPIAAALGRA